MMAEYQDADPDLKALKLYLLHGELLEEEKKAREFVLGRSQIEVIDGVLYHVESDKTLRVILPMSYRKMLFEEAHREQFGAHLGSSRVDGQLVRTYWWSTMRTNITHWSRSCTICASRQVGQPLHPLLTPLPVGGPFDRIGVDVIQFPKSSKGNKYAVVFMDYLTKWPEVFPTRD